MKMMITIPESEEILEKYNTYMDLVNDLKNGTVNDLGREIIYNAVRIGIRFLMIL